MSHTAPVLFRDMPKEQLETLYPAVNGKLPFHSDTYL